MDVLSFECYQLMRRIAINLELELGDILSHNLLMT